MKKVSLVILGLICWIGCFAQTEPIVFDNNGEFSRVVEVKSTAKQAFQYCRSFLSSKIKDYQRAVQTEDPNTNRIQVNYQFRFIEDAQPLAPSTKSYYDAYEVSKLTVDCKDNKIRIKVENPVYNYNFYAANRLFDSKQNAEYWLVSGMVLDKNHFQTMRSNEYLRIILGLKLYIEEQVKNDDW